MAGSAVHPRDAEFLRLAKRAGRRARRAALFAAETALHAAPVAHDIVMTYMKKYYPDTVKDEPVKKEIKHQATSVEE